MWSCHPSVSTVINDLHTSAGPVEYQLSSPHLHGCLLLCPPLFVSPFLFHSPFSFTPSHICHLHPSPVFPLFLFSQSLSACYSLFPHTSSLYLLPSNVSLLCPLSFQFYYLKRLRMTTSGGRP